MDQDLVVRVQNGDQRAFETLATSDYPRLHRVAYSVLGDSVSAEDATQQAYLDIWRNLRRLRDPSKYEAWSYRLLVRACYAEAGRLGCRLFVLRCDTLRPFLRLHRHAGDRQATQHCRHCSQ